MEYGKEVFGYTEESEKDTCSKCENFLPQEKMCELFDELKEECPEYFENIDSSVSKDGNCLAFMKMKPSLDNLKKKAKMVEEEEDSDIG